jgi:plastocyanin
MRKSSQRIAMLASVALLGAALVGTAGVAKAQGELNVQVGAPLFEAGGPAPAEGMRFYAPELNVHQGDTINFQWAGFHTATLLPANEDGAAWVAANASQLGQPYFIINEDPDDTGLDEGSSAAKPAVKFNNAVLLPSDFTCGTADNPCSHDGSGVVNSGLPVDPASTGFSTTIDVAPNNSFWVVCLLHPNQLLKVNVVDAADPTTTQAEIDAYRDATVASDAAAATDLHKQLNKQRKRNGAWQAYGGADGDGFALLAMYPKKLVVRKGDRVRWRFDRLPFEIHTVSFPRSTAADIIQGDFVPGCDPDGDAGAGPDNPPDLEGPPFCLDPSQLEFEFEPRTIYQYGNGTFKGNDFETSGVRGDFGLSTDSYTLKFGKKSPKKGFKYMCMIHGRFQSGTVVVKNKK